LTSNGMQRIVRASTRPTGPDRRRTGAAGGEQSLADIEHRGDPRGEGDQSGDRDGDQPAAADHHGPFRSAEDQLENADEQDDPPERPELFPGKPGGGCGLARSRRRPVGTATPSCHGRVAATTAMMAISMPSRFCPAGIFCSTEDPAW
jgi:hypothetical protein